MAEYDVNEILAKDGLEHVDLGDGSSIMVTKLKELISDNSKHESWAKRVIDTMASNTLSAATSPDFIAV